RADFADRPEWTEPRVEIPEDVRSETNAQRRAKGISQKDLCAAIGIRQPVTFYAWEKGTSRPAVTHWRAYLTAVGADVEAVMKRCRIGANRLNSVWEEQDASANRVRDYVRLSGLQAEDLEHFAGREDLELTPEHYGKKGIRRFVDVTPELLTLLG